MKERRKFYRVKYSKENGPIFRTQEKSFRTVDLSEEGIRFHLNGETGFQIGMKISGSITFNDNESFLIHGVINWGDSSEVGLKLTRPVPLRKIMSEQRLQIEKFPSKNTA